MIYTQIIHYNEFQYEVNINFMLTGSQAINPLYYYS